MKKSSLNDGIEVYGFLKDLGNGENGFNLTPPKKLEEFKVLMKKFVDGETIVAPNRVPQSIYWMCDKDIPVGMLKIRKTLTKGLLENGGNMGYAVSPFHRGKGYGTKIVEEGLKILKEANLEKVLVTVYEDNIPSRKAVEANGGILTEISANLCKYWITL